MSKFSKKTIFIVFLSNQEKQQNNKKTVTLAHAAITCLVKISGSTSTFGGCFLSVCFFALPNLQT